MVVLVAELPVLALAVESEQEVVVEVQQQEVALVVAVPVEAFQVEVESLGELLEAVEFQLDRKVLLRPLTNHLLHYQFEIFCT